MNTIAEYGRWAGEGALNLAAEKLGAAKEFGKSFTINTGKFLTGINNLEAAKKALSTSVKQNIIILNGSAPVVESVPVSFGERLNTAGKEVWTAAGKVMVGAAFWIGAGSKLAQSVGLMDAPSTLSGLNFAEHTYSAGVTLMSTGASMAVNGVSFMAVNGTSFVVNHPKTVALGAVASTSIYLAHQGCKDIVSMNKNKTTVAYDGANMRITISPSTWTESGTQLCKGISKIAGSVLVAASGYKALL